MRAVTFISFALVALFVVFSLASAYPSNDMEWGLYNNDFNGKKIKYLQCNK